MTAGDVISDIQSIAAASSLTFQPAAGVEVLISQVGSSEQTGTAPTKAGHVSVALTNGSDTSHVIGEASTLSGMPLRLFINNTNYLSIKNTGTGNQDLSYCGIQTQ